MRALPSLLVLGVVLRAAPVVADEVLRLAVVVGNNEGAGGRPPLRFAESDAQRFARVLVELGAFAADDVHLFQGRGAEEIRRGLEVARRKVVAWRDSHEGGRAQLMFFYSGHSDGQSLELSRTLLPFAEVKQRVSATGADVRVVVLDSCKSGALLGSKGGVPGRGFDIQLADELQSRGEALLTSAASDEVALESRELGASFFSHHFISALRGVADGNGDGRVTLQEAYQHAYARTLAETASSIYGPQHANYDYKISGQGDLVLTDLARPGAVLELPGGFDRMLVTSETEVLVESRGKSARRVGLSPGSYVVRAWRGRELRQAVVALAPGSHKVIAVEDLGVAIPMLASAKGDLEAGAAGGHGLLASFSLGASRHTTPLPLLGFRMLAGTRQARGFHVALEGLAAPSETDAGWATELLGGVGYRLGWDGLASGRLSLWLTAELQAGRVTTPRGMDDPPATGRFALAATPGVGASFALGRGLSLSVEGLVAWMRLFGGSAGASDLSPRTWLGLIWQL